ncbi:MAG: YfjI family protein [Candidatus Ozemobacteraceae bacterium]
MSKFGKKFSVQPPVKNNIESDDLNNLDSDGISEEKDGWHKPTSFNRSVLPKIPKGCFPQWVENLIDATAAATETPRELGVGLALFTLSTACQKVFSTMTQPNYFEQSSLFLLMVMDSSNRKTAVRKHFIDPIFKRQDELGKVAAKLIAEAVRKNEMADAAIDGIKRELSKASSAKNRSREDFEAEIVSVEDNRPRIPTIPRLLVSDITSERLPVLMSENGERMGLFADEGGIFDTIGGRYSKGIPNMDIFLQGYSGAPYIVDRGSRPPISLRDPAISMCVFCQTEVLAGLGDIPGFRSRGFMGRVLYLIPPSNLGYRTHQTTPINPAIIKEYSRKMAMLLAKTPATVMDHSSHMHSLELEIGAHRAWKDFEAMIEATMKPGGSMESMTDYAGKVPGQVARIAGLLHCAEYAEGEPQEHKIGKETMDKAISIMGTFVEHAKHAYGLAGIEKSIEDAKIVLDWIERKDQTSFKRRDAQHEMQSHFKKVRELEAALKILVERNYIKPEKGKTNPEGGRPSAIYEVNPWVVKRMNPFSGSFD